MASRGGNEFGKDGKQELETVGMKKWMKPRSTPVSYTHLDVYKRQLLSLIFFLCEN